MRASEPAVPSSVSGVGVSELGGLEWAEGEYPTPYGTVSVKCRKTGDGKISVEYKAPEQIEIETGSGVSM